jgi:hypothetical protein
MTSDLLGAAGLGLKNLLISPEIRQRWALSGGNGGSTSIRLALLIWSIV